MVGGYEVRGGGGGLAHATWSWNGRTWHRLRTTGQPTRRSLHAMAYDPVHDEVVLFGGERGAPRNDTWILKGNEWTERQPAASPPGVSLPVMAYDPNSQQVILFGGFQADGSSSDQTWAWDGSTWTRLAPAQSPPASYGAGLAFDPSRQALVLFGGWSDGALLDQTWTWDGSTWTWQAPLTSPDARYFHGMATFRQHVVAFGGRRYDAVYEDDIWILGDHRWRELRPLGPLPIGREGPQLEWDPRTREVVLFGGDSSAVRFNDTWTLPAR